MLLCVAPFAAGIVPVGIGAATVAVAAEAGVDVCVAGTAVFKAEDPAEAIRFLQAF